MKLSEIRAKYPQYEDLSDDQLLIGLHKRFYSDIPIGEFTKKIEYDTNVPDATQGMSGFDKFRAGMGKAFTDVARGVGQAVGVVDRNDVAESRKRDKSLMDTGAGMAGNIAGNVAALAPTAFIPGANTVTGAATVGAVSGLLAPSASTEETLTNTGIGGVAGAAVPAAMLAAKTGKAFIEPLYEAGRNKIVGRAISETAGVDPKQLAAVLRSNKSAVPGVERTVAEVADNPSLAAMQRAATQTNPIVMNEAAARQAANNEARVFALRELAGTEGKREFHDAARKAAANELYEKAYEKGVNLTRDAATGRFSSKAQIAGTKGEITKLMQRPAIQQAMQDAKILAKNEGVNINDPSGSVKGLDYLKRALDDQIGKTSGNEQRVLVDLKQRLLTTVDRLSPDYAQARKTFAEMSRPISQMDVAQKIADKAINPLNETLYPQQFARALSDDTVKAVTGMKKATLESVMDPQQLTALTSIQDDLARQQFAQNAGRGVGSDTVQKLAYSNILNQAGVPSAVRNFGPSGIVGSVAERAGNILYKDANEKLSEKLARALLDPQQAATLVEQGMVTPQMVALANGLKRGGTVLGATAPALVSANQQ